MNDKEEALNNEKKIKRASELVNDIYGAEISQLLSDKLQQSPDKAEKFCKMIETEHEKYFDKVISSIESGETILEWSSSSTVLEDMGIPVVGKFNKEFLKRKRRLTNTDANLAVISDQNGSNILNSIAFLPSYFRGKEAKVFLLANNNYREFLNVFKTIFGEKSDDVITELVSAIKKDIDEENESNFNMFQGLIPNYFIPSARKHFDANRKISDAISKNLPKAAVIDEYETRQENWDHMKNVIDHLKGRFGLSEEVKLDDLTDEIVLLPEDVAAEKLKDITVKIKDLMIKSFNIDELKELCIHLNLEDEELPKSSPVRDRVSLARTSSLEVN